jgi:hypothetical protein
MPTRHTCGNVPRSPDASHARQRQDLLRRDPRHQGGELVQPIGANAPEITARISDPAGNVIGLYQEPDAGGGGDESDFRALHTHPPELTDS